RAEVPQQRPAARRADAGHTVELAADAAAGLAVVGDREAVRLVAQGRDQQRLRRARRQRHGQLAARQEQALAALRARVADALQPALREPAQPEVVLQPELGERALGGAELA